MKASAPVRSATTGADPATRAVAEHPDALRVDAGVRQQQREGRLGVLDPVGERVRAAHTARPAGSASVEADGRDPTPGRQDAVGAELRPWAVAAPLDEHQAGKALTGRGEQERAGQPHTVGALELDLLDHDRGQRRRERARELDGHRRLGLTGTCVHQLATQRARAGVESQSERGAEERDLEAAVAHRHAGRLRDQTPRRHVERAGEAVLPLLEVERDREQGAIALDRPDPVAGSRGVARGLAGRREQGGAGGDEELEEGAHDRGVRYRMDSPVPRARKKSTIREPAVFPDAAPESLGPRLRGLRKRQRMTLEQLADRSGVSRAMLSKIERGETSPTLVVAARVAGALGVGFSELVGAARERRRAVVTRRGERVVFRDDNSGFVRELVSPPFENRRFELVRHVLPEGAATGTLPPYPAGVEKQLVVDSGRLRVEVADEAFELAKGDGLFFEADVGHQFVNAGRGECRYYLVVTAAPRP